ncbi:hypothetical protein MKW92_008100 [Papaver armeniacum]|nr:hypothetical protein MKW92_008100 [Papaver armeniacum]
MAENGDEKLIAVARHIAKTLGRTETMTDDILQIFSTFDGRFSREKLSSENNNQRGVGVVEDGDPRAGYGVLDLTLKTLDRQISQYVSSDQPIWSNLNDSSEFLDAIDELLATIRDWEPISIENKPIASFLDRADDLLQQAMFRLEDEFRLLIEKSSESFDLNRLNRSDSVGDNNNNFSSDSEDEDSFNEDRIPVAQPVSDYDIVIDALPSGVIADLHEIAKRMVLAGFEKECAHVYSSCRRDFLEESISRLGLQRLSIDEVQKMPWSDLEDEIERWMKGANVALKILFPSERRICDRIFFGLSAAADLSFMEVCRGSTIQLLNFADAVAIGSRSPERLFKVLDVYETLRDLMPEFEAVFNDQYCVVLRNEAATIWKRDPAKAAVPGGGLHPITRYVMNYLRAACGSRSTLEQVFEDNGSDYRTTDGMNDRPLSSTSSLSVQITWIMELLESNLEAKSKMYKDAALSSVFLMNNGRYIVQKVKDSELASLLGEDWLRKHSGKVRQCHVNYQRSSWSKVLAVLKLDSSSLTPNTAPRVLKDKVKIFTQYFDEICRSQSTWVVADEQLRMELRISVAGNLSPAYRNFLGRFHTVPELARNSDKYVRYSVEDIEARVNELFKGNGAAAGGRK